MCKGRGAGGMSRTMGSGWGPTGGGGPGTPVGHSALLSDSVAPHGEAHAHDGAGDEDEEDDEGTDQQVQEGVQEGAAGSTGSTVTGTTPGRARPRGRAAQPSGFQLGRQAARGQCHFPQLPLTLQSLLLAPGCSPILPKTQGWEPLFLLCHRGGRASLRPTPLGPPAYLLERQDAIQGHLPTWPSTLWPGPVLGCHLTSSDVPIAS